MRIITVTADYGMNSIYAASLKGHLLRYSKSSIVQDISLTISPYDIREAAFILKSTYACFPPDTIHLIDVGTYINKPFRTIAFSIESSVVIAPDNGVVSLLELPISNAVEISTDVKQITPLGFTQLAQVAYLSNLFKIDVIECSLKVVNDYYHATTQKPVLDHTKGKGTILHIDSYGNMISNISYSEFERYRQTSTFALQVRGHKPIRQVSTFYGQNSSGGLLMRVHSSGFIELAVSHGSAQKLTGMSVGDQFSIEFFS